MKKLILVCCIMLLCSASRRGRYHDLSKNLIAHYKMNDSADSTVVIDETGNHNGTFYGAGGTDNYTSSHSVTGKINGALEFDGTDDYIVVADHDDFSFGDGSSDNPFSVTVWTYIGNAYRASFAWKFDTGKKEWYLGTSSNHDLYFELWDENNGGHFTIHLTNTLEAYENRWIFLAATYDGSSSFTGAKIYLNGSLGSLSRGDVGTYVSMENTTVDLLIGKNNGLNHFDGLNDNVMIFNKELTADDVAFLYNGGEGREHLNRTRF